MKKFICILIVISILISCFSISGFASASENFTILTKHSSGEITSEVKNFSRNTLSQFSINDNYLNVEEYIPENSIYQYSDKYRTSTTDEHGRSPASDARIGYLLCGFDTDGDGDCEEWAYGTASLQHYDIIISCAHVLWKEQYLDCPSEGWADEITFYAGRQNNYCSAISSYSSVSISTGYIDSVVSGGNGSDFDWSIVQLADNIGGQVGWFGLHGCGTPETGVSVNTIGYPEDKGTVTQWKSSGTMNSFYSNSVFCSVYSCGGNSGGPLLNNGLVYGIIKGHANDSSGNWSHTVGVRIFDELFGLIVESREESEARWT